VDRTEKLGQPARENTHFQPGLPLFPVLRPALDVAVNRKKNKGHLSGSIPGLQVAPEVVAASGLRDVLNCG
jgi:hypothetical protein